MKKLFFGILSFAFCFSFPLAEITPAAVSSMTAAAEESAETEGSVIVDNIQYQPVLDYYEAEKVTDTTITSVTIPAKINDKDVLVRDNIFGRCYHLEKINVEEGNVCHSSIDGVLFLSDTLIAYPCAKTDTAYTIPENVTRTRAAFQNCNYLKSVTLSENLTYMWQPFKYCYNLEEINGAIVCPDSIPVISCPKIKRLHFKGGIYPLSLGQRDFPELESIICDDDATVSDVWLLSSSTLKEIYLPAPYHTAIIKNCENLETLHINNHSPSENHVTWSISDCPNLKEIIVDHIEGGSIEAPIKLKNLPALKSITYYEPHTCNSSLQTYLDYWHSHPSAAQPELTLESLKGELLEHILYQGTQMQIAENCGQFTVYGHNKNEVLKYSCQKYDIPFVPLELDTGDLTGDNEIDIRDVIQLNQSIFGKATLIDVQKKAADVNGDGIADAADSLLIMKYIVGLIDNFT